MYHRAPLSEVSFTAPAMHGSPSAFSGTATTLSWYFFTSLIAKLSSRPTDEV
jgi:hypothetical protein